MCHLGAFLVTPVSRRDWMRAILAQNRARTQKCPLRLPLFWPNKAKNRAESHSQIRNGLPLRRKRLPKSGMRFHSSGNGFPKQERPSTPAEMASGMGNDLPLGRKRLPNSRTAIRSSRNDLRNRERPSARAGRHSENSEDLAPRCLEKTKRPLLTERPFANRSWT
jgi:hypothetical protein